MDFFQNKRICDRILAFSGIKIRSICFSFIFSPFSGSFYHIMFFHSIKMLRDRRFFMVLYIQHRISPFLPSWGVFDDLQIGILSAMRKTSYQEEFHADKPDALSLFPFFAESETQSSIFSFQAMEFSVRYIENHCPAEAPWFSRGGYM